ncbi:Type II/IV secretion system ATP hydrolase TadA/VirB11/CpaF, TadA subfamily, partial [hydrothermal vent metagenome]
MKIWYHKLNESERTLIDTDESVITIGRNQSNVIRLSSPLISQRQAVVKRTGDKLKLENTGINSCLIGDHELIGGESLEFALGETVRIWPYTLTFESEQAVQINSKDVESHLRSQLADLELHVHEILLKRFDLFELNSTRVGNRENILLLENHIEDICREFNLFDEENSALLEEICGLVFRDLVINQLIMENKEANLGFHNYLTHNEFDIPATLVTERETEIASLLHFTFERLKITQLDDLTLQIKRVEEKYAALFPLIRPHLHTELKKYLINRTLKKDLKDTVFGFGPLQDLLRAPTISEIMVVTSDQIYVERDGVLELSGRRFISDKVTESIIERIVSEVGRRIDKSQPLVDARLPDGSRVNAIIPPLALRGPCLTIRKFPAHRLSIDDLLEYGTLTEAAALFLRACVIAHRNILVSGGTGTGKTTMLNVLSGFIPHKERIVTIEDTAELKLHQEHVVGLES